MRKLMLLLLFSFLGPQSEMRLKAAQVTNMDVIRIFSHGIKIPEGYILLIRKDRDIYGLRFSKCTRKGQYDATADYEVLQLNRKGAPFRSKLYLSRPFGIGRFTFAWHSVEVKIGNSRLFWSGEEKGAFLEFSHADQPVKDYGFEFSPTPWKEFEQIDYKNENLFWFRYDSARAEMTLRITEIEKKLTTKESKKREDVKKR